MNPSSNLEDVFYSVLKEAAIGQSPSLNLDNMLDIATLSGVLFNINKFYPPMGMEIGTDEYWRFLGDNIQFPSEMYDNRFKILGAVETMLNLYNQAKARISRSFPESVDVKLKILSTCDGCLSKLDNILMFIAPVEVEWSSQRIESSRSIEIITDMGDVREDIYSVTSPSMISPSMISPRQVSPSRQVSVSRQVPLPVISPRQVSPSRQLSPLPMTSPRQRPLSRSSVDYEVDEVEEIVEVKRDRDYKLLKIPLYQDFPYVILGSGNRSSLINSLNLGKGILLYPSVVVGETLSPIPWRILKKWLLDIGMYKNPPEPSVMRLGSDLASLTVNLLSQYPDLIIAARKLYPEIKLFQSNVFAVPVESILFNDVDVVDRRGNVDIERRTLDVEQDVLKRNVYSILPLRFPSLRDPELSNETVTLYIDKRDISIFDYGRLCEAANSPDPGESKISFLPIQANDVPLVGRETLLDSRTLTDAEVSRVIETSDNNQMGKRFDNPITVSVSLIGLNILSKEEDGVLSYTLVDPPFLIAPGKLEVRDGKYEILDDSIVNLNRFIELISLISPP